MKRFLLSIEIAEEPDEIAVEQIAEEIRDVLHLEGFMVARCVASEQMNATIVMELDG